MSNMTGPYQQTLNDLELRRAKCLEDLNKIEAAITGLRAAMELNVNLKAGETVSAHIASPIEHLQRYANMSVRWAILKLLADHFLGRSMKTADISEELTGGGNAKAVRATVSAVISDMVNKRGELQLTDDGGYALTDSGRMAWNAIKHSTKYLSRADSAGQALPL